MRSVRRSVGFYQAVYRVHRCGNGGRRGKCCQRQDAAAGGYASGLG